MLHLHYAYTREFPFSQIPQPFVLSSPLWSKSRKSSPFARFIALAGHLHLVLLGNSDGTDLLQVVAHFKQATGHWPSLHRPSVRWQRSFYDRILRAHEVHRMISYVLDNPVRRNLVDDWRKYPFTGAIGLNLEEFLESL